MEDVIALIKELPVDVTVHHVVDVGPGFGIMVFLLSIAFLIGLLIRRR